MIQYVGAILHNGCYKICTLLCVIKARQSYPLSFAHRSVIKGTIPRPFTPQESTPLVELLPILLRPLTDLKVLSLKGQFSFFAIALGPVT